MLVRNVPGKLHAALAGSLLLFSGMALAQTNVPEPLLPGTTTLQGEEAPRSALDDVDLPPPDLLRVPPTQTQTTLPSPLLDNPYRSPGKRPPDIIGERVRFRKAKTRALKSPGVVAAAADIDSAKTDPEKMEARYRFYRLLFSEMRRIDRSLALLKPIENETYARLKGSYIPAENRAVIRVREE